MSQNLPNSIINTTPWNSKNESLWLASSFTIRRNLRDYLFPSKLQGPEIHQVIETLKTSILGEMQSAPFLTEKDLSSTQRDFLIEHFLFFHGFSQSPNGAGMFVDEKGTLLTTLNMGNHLEIRVLGFESDWGNDWKRFMQIENQIGKALTFAFSPKFGYLTSDPAHCGTGLTVSAYLHLPALIHSGQIQSAIDNSREEGVNFVGLSGTLEELVGDIIVVHNAYCIGVSEDAILHAISQTATKLVGAEKTMRAHLKQEPNTHIKDAIAKAFGLIRHSVQLETKEALELLSLMKLGLALGYITGITDQKLSELFFTCRRGHLCQLFPELKEPEAISQKRADYLQEQLKEITVSTDLQ